MSLRRVLGALLVIGGLVGVAAASTPAAALLPACAPIPGGSCYGDQVNVYNLTDAGPDPSCSSCLQGKDCCEQVGRCEDDPTGTCVKSITATHACVLEGGAPEEARCRGKLGDPLSQDVYTCMRKSCGDKCGVPSCDLNTSVTLIENPDCDRCIGSACCGEIDRCYGNRSCKLVVQCITDRCPKSFGPALTLLGENGPDALEAARQAICNGTGDGGPGGGVGGGGHSFDIPACLARCLDEFAPDDGGTVQDKEARCFAFSVYTCGARYKCGPSCVVPDGSAYATRDPFPEDDLDAGSRPDAQADAQPDAQRDQ